MRTINKYFYLLAAVALAGMVSCVKEKEEFTPGDPDSETCEGVYFIKQDVIEEMQIFDPTQEKKDRIIVARTNSDGALTVTPRVGLSIITSEGVEDGDASVFTVSDIVFADGQEESYVDLDFSKVKEGVQYSLHLSIDGDENSSKYSSSLKACDYKVLCVAYKTFSQPKADEKDPDVPARITFKHGWWQETRTALIKYYEVDGVRHCVTYDEKLADGEETNGEHEEKGGFWGVNPDQHLSFLWYTADVEEGKCGDCEDGHPHAIPAGYAAPEGAELITFDGFQEYDFGWEAKPVVVDYYYYQRQGGYSKGYLHFVDANALFDNASYYDGNGGFFFWILGYNTMGNRNSGWGFPEDYDIVGIAEGYTRADYSLDLTAGMPEPDEDGENVVPVDFEVGADVDLLAYTILKGNVSSAVVNNEATAIVKDTISHKYATWVEANGKSFSDEISCPETGMYTLVAVAIDTVHVKAKTKATDANGVKYVFAHKNTASVYFKYLKAGDAGQVVLNVEAATTEGLESRGWNPETSLQYTITGSGITGAIPMIYSQNDVKTAGGIDAIIEDIKSDPNKYYSLLSDKDFDGALSAEQLASVNDNGFTDIVDGIIVPGTMFYVVVWATNGYDTTVEYATMTTTGEALPIYNYYDWNSYNAEYAPDDETGLYGTYNVYAVAEKGSSTLRRYIGKAVIADDEENPNEGPDDDGLYDEYVTISGLGGSSLAQYGLNPSITFDYYDGALYVAADATTDEMFDLHCFDISKGSYQTWAGYAGYFIPVDEGYWAYMGQSYYYSNYGLNFDGLQFLYEDESYAGYYKYLLVDVNVDNNGVAPNSVVARPQSGMPKWNGVSMTEGPVVDPAAKARFNKAFVNEAAHFITPVGVKGLTPTVKRVEAGHKLSIVPPMTVKEYNTPTVQFSARNI